MNHYCESAFRHIRAAADSIVAIVGTLNEDDLPLRPTPGKHSLGELLAHLVTILKADTLIADGASRERMEAFYSAVSLSGLNAMTAALTENLRLLEEKYAAYTEDELQEKTAAYWGVEYTRFEWLLEMAVHLYHHRGQLHAMLVHGCGKDPRVPLFEGGA